MGAGALLNAQTFAIDVPLIALLSRQFAVKRLLLVRPKIALRIDAEGRRNWTLAAPTGTEAQATAGSAGAQRAPAAPAGAPASRDAGVRSVIDRLRLENVEIRDGTLRYHDERRGARQTLLVGEPRHPHVHHDDARHEPGYEQDATRNSQPAVRVGQQLSPVEDPEE